MSDHTTRVQARQNRARLPNDAGVALIIVILVMSLATVLVVQLAHSTFLSNRSVGMVERQLQSEYLLKSIINFGIALIDSDASPNVDAREDFWALFIDGKTLPPGLTGPIGLTPPGVNASLEITPLESRFNLNRLGEAAIANQAPSVKRLTRSAEILRNLFVSLSFDDELAEEDHTGLFPGRVFTSDELVSILRDYLDTDKDPEPVFDPVAGFPEGIDNDPSVKEHMKNSMLDSIEELIRVPGFTPNRVRRLSPFVVAHRGARQNKATPARMNFNFTPLFLLNNLHGDIDETGAQLIYDRARLLDEETQEVGFSAPNEVNQILQEADPSGNAARDLADFITVNSQYFRIIAAVEYGSQGTYLAQALVYHSSAGVEVEHITVY